MDTCTTARTKFYLEPFCFSFTAKCVSISNLGLIFDSTIFNPCVRGQPGSIGTVTFKTENDIVIPVVDTIFDKSGQIIHKIPTSLISTSFVGKFALLSINHFQRILDSRYHSASHLVDVALFSIVVDFSLNLKKIAKNVVGSLEYSGTIPEKLKLNVETALRDQIDSFFTNPKYFPKNKNSKIRRETVKYIKDVAPAFRDTIKKLPCDIVKFDGYGFPCNACHVEHFGQISVINITKIQENLEENTTSIFFNVDIPKNWIKDTCRFEFGTVKDLERIVELEYREFPADEADQPKWIKDRLINAQEYFLKVSAYGMILGYVNGTTFKGEYSKVNMAKHDPAGNHLGIHGVVVDKVFSKRGIASEMLRRYIDMIKPNIEKISLICHDYLIPFYSKFGFKNQGDSNIILGKSKWYLMSKNLQGH